MKKIFKPGIMIVSFMILFSGCGIQNYSTLSTVSTTVTFQSFYDDLGPYGIWIDYPGYGQVWHPQLNTDFRPYYTNGYWIYATEGWTWVSNYNWGWGPFHYGRWFYDDFYGWMWVPGYEWSPAWVTWGYYNDYYAWAPLMPGVNVNIQFNTWRPNQLYWNICPRKDIYDHDLQNKMVRADRFQDFDNRVNILNNFSTTRNHREYYSKGPDVSEVQKYSSSKIEEVKLKDVRKVNPVPEKRDVRNVFRPAIPVESRPKEYKRVEIDRIKPIRNNDQQPVVPKAEQNKNIERLPVFKTERTAPVPIPTGNINEKPSRRTRKNINN